MAKDINLTSQQWNDIIFEGKNKDYGAYEMRMSSSKRHVIAFLSTLMFAIFVVVLPVLIETVTVWVMPPERLYGEFKLTNLKPIEEEYDKLDKIAASAPPPKQTQQSSTIVIVENTEPVDNFTFDTEDTPEIDGIYDYGDGQNETDYNVENTSGYGAVGEGSGEGRIQTKVEEAPEFPGGEDARMKFLSNNIKYPQIAKELALEGKVWVEFVVEPDGNLSNIKIIRSIAQPLDNEAIRVTQLMPKWNPGKQRGKAVRTRCVMQITFILNT